MALPIYSAATPSAVASGTSAKSILGVKAHANSGLQVVNWRVAFAGVTASAVPVLVQLCYATFATNSPGTNSTSVTVAQVSGRVLTAGFTAGHTWTTEPTVLTPLYSQVVAPDKGLVIEGVPLGFEPDCALAEGFVLRVTAAATVDLWATMLVSRI
jgi:hypothetical protein